MKLRYGPIEIGLGTNLVGTDDLVLERLRLYRDAGITTLRANLHADTADLDGRLSDLARLLDLVQQVNDEVTGSAATSLPEVPQKPRQ